MIRDNIDYAFTATPFGEVLVAATGKGVCALFFYDGTDSRGGAVSRDGALTELKKLFPRAVLSERLTPMLKKAAEAAGSKGAEVPLDLRGTPFQLAVWDELMKIPRGELAAYSDIAARVGRPKACRAVGTAVGSNPVSVIVPCHRVVRGNGELGGYRWGPERKKSLLDYELERAI